MSRITSHVLDTSRGKPAAGIPVILFQYDNNHWIEMSSTTTNKDGRITDLLAKDIALPNGIYKLKFMIKEYFDAMGAQTFYPFIEVIFEITGNEHYHVPLLLNPFGYSTYRGS